MILVLGHRAGDIQAHLNDPTIQYVLNPDPDSDMAASIACGVQAAPETTGAFVIAPGDHPAVDEEVTKLLIQNGAVGRDWSCPNMRVAAGIRFWLIRPFAVSCCCSVLRAGCGLFFRTIKILSLEFRWKQPSLHAIWIRGMITARYIRSFWANCPVSSIRTREAAKPKAILTQLNRQPAHLMPVRLQ